MELTTLRGAAEHPSHWAERAIMWSDLKDAELKGLRERLSGVVRRRTARKLRRLLAEVADQPDADEAICFHGAWALVYEAAGQLRPAIRHRRFEIRQIQRLQSEMAGRPGEDFALQNYGAADLLVRQEILASLERAMAARFE